MSRVLVAGGAGLLGSAVVRLLLADPAYEVTGGEVLFEPRARVIHLGSTSKASLGSNVRKGW